MASLDDVRAIALTLPESSERSSRGQLQWRVRDKLSVWERPLRGSDLRALGDAAPDGPILGARVEHEGAKQALIQSEPDAANPGSDPYMTAFAIVLLR